MYGGLAGASPENMAAPMYEVPSSNGGMSTCAADIFLLIDFQQGLKVRCARIRPPRPCHLFLISHLRRQISLGHMSARHACDRSRVWST